jgi:adenine-specific DNA-methyltransferase
MPVLESHILVDGKSRASRHELGQFLTPAHVAEFMASLFEVRWRHLNLLDAGAGAGALTAALVRRICHERIKPQSISVTAFEFDPAMFEPLRETLLDCQRLCEQAGIAFSSTLRLEDFIEAGSPMVRQDLFSAQPLRFNAAIVNPPYRKIRSDSVTRESLRSAGIETSNLYTGFVALIAKMLVKGGELVAITPRSFCNGPYFRPFREDFLHAMSLRRLHVFDSRSAAFGGDDVLQENVIVHAVKDLLKPTAVAVSSSSGQLHGVVTTRQVDYDEVVLPGDPEQFIHLQVEEKHSQAREVLARLPASLADLGLRVSTGRVVDFRAASHLRQQPDKTTAPLIYPCHFNGGFVHWPRPDSRKPNAIQHDSTTRDLLVPAGVYVLVKRFTAKEERRRIVACIYDSARILAPWVGFENHLNYFHLAGRGLPLDLAKGLSAFLNSTVVDVYFRQFSGHTQVNATDLRALNYPSKTALEQLGQKIADPGLLQDQLDALVEKELF